jgi:DNA polymerase III sliding clamp (beta) subunit (PCNA family)
MKAICNSVELKKALSFAMGFVGKTSINVVHRKLYVKFIDDDHVLLKSTNGVLYSQVACPAEIVETGDEAYLIDAATFSSIVSTCREGPIKFAYGGKTTRLRITQGGLRRRLATEKPEDFPEIPNVGEENAFELSLSELSHYIGTITFAAASVYENPVLRGIYFDSENDFLIAADGMRLATVTFPMDISSEIVLIPETLGAMSSLLRVVDAPAITLRYGSAGWVQIEGDTASVWVGTLAGSYPAKGNVIMKTLLDRTDGTVINSTKDTLLPILNMASVYSDIAAQEQSTRGVVVEVKDKVIQFSIKTSSGGMDDQLLDQDVVGSDVTVMISPQQLHQAITACPTEDVVLRVFSPFEPIVITSLDESIGWTVIQTPMGSKETHAQWEEARKQFATEEEAPLEDDDYDDF